ncbi:hypothetical protein FRC08_012507 [Ceratobasidium sp. 394]|nr:hypothetical protein FRC08_012507 [Ceratobasidium sp. 394]KAG9092815.1 hypothetical protein FS749_015429 [Ceratobasidium sp. UAMH 11750]
METFNQTTILLVVAIEECLVDLGTEKECPESQAGRFSLVHDTGFDGELERPKYDLGSKPNIFQKAW